MGRRAPSPSKKNAWDSTNSPAQQGKKGVAVEEYIKKDPLTRLANSPYNSRTVVKGSSSPPTSRASSAKGSRPVSSSSRRSDSRSARGGGSGSVIMAPRERMAILESQMQEAQTNKDWQASTQICIELLALAQLAYGTDSLSLENQDRMVSDYYQLARAQWNLANCYLQQKLVYQAVEHATRAADILALSDTPETKNVRIAKPDKSNVNEVEGYTDQDRRSLQAAVLITLAIGYTLGKKYKDAHSALSLALQVGPEPVPIYKAIAKVFLAEKKEEEALEALDTALQLQLTYGADDDIQIAEISKEMGRLSLLKGDAQGSFASYTRARTHYTNVAPDSFEVAECGLQLGAALAKSGDYTAALPLLEEAVTAYELHKGPLHPSSLSVLRDRALLLLHANLPSPALQCLQALAARQGKALGKKSIKLAETMRLMGTAHEALGDAHSALFVYVEAQQRYEKKYGRDYKKVKSLRPIIKKLKEQVGDVGDDDESEEEEEEDDMEEYDSYEDKRDNNNEDSNEDEYNNQGSNDDSGNDDDGDNFGNTDNKDNNEGGEEETSEYAKDDFEDDNENDET